MFSSKKLAHPAPVLICSVMLHVVVLVSLIVDPAAWRWALGAIGANHLALGTLALHPRGRLLGPNVSRLPAPSAQRREVALTIDDGPDPDVTPLVLDILDAHQAKATFFCIGRLVAQHPELARDILRRGHALENHSDHHRWWFAMQGPRGLTREIEAGQRAITEVTGKRPTLFRAPAGVRSPLLELSLQRIGLTLVSWTRRGFDTVDRNPDTVLARLLRRLASGDILLLHDGHAARTRAGTPVIVEVLPRLLTAIRAAGLTTVTLTSLVQ